MILATRFFNFLFILSILLIFQEQYFFEYFALKGIYLSTLFGVLGSLGTFLISLKNKTLFTIFNQSLIYKAAVFWIILLSITALFSNNPLETYKYISIIVIGVFYSFNFYLAFRELNPDSFINPTAVVIIVATMISIYDFFAIREGWIVFNKVPEMYRLVSGFRYFAVTADFAQFMLSILTPYMIVFGNDFVNEKKKTALVYGAILLGVILLIGTTRISVIISFAISCLISFFLNIRKLSFKRILTGLALSLVLCVGFFYAFSDIFHEIIYRINKRITNRQSKDLAGDFFTENIYKSFNIFCKNPIKGVGLGQSQICVDGGVYSVHGTFFKLLSETGLLGTLGYIVFLATIILFFYKNLKDKSGNSIFLFQFLPYFVGLMISSFYNTFFYRIEFWLFVAVFQILASKKYAKQS